MSLGKELFCIKCEFMRMFVGHHANKSMAEASNCLRGNPPKAVEARQLREEINYFPWPKFINKSPQQPPSHDFMSQATT